MSNNINVDINLSELASQLGVASQELIAMYVPRAYAELLDPVLIAAVAAFIFWARPRVVKAFVDMTVDVEERKGVEEIANVITFIIVLAISFLAFVIGAAELSYAIVAITSPEAYAVNEILSRL